MGSSWGKIQNRKVGNQEVGYDILWNNAFALVLSKKTQWHQKPLKNILRHRTSWAEENSLHVLTVVTLNGGIRWLFFSLFNFCAFSMFFITGLYYFSIFHYKMLTINKLDKVYVVSMYVCWYVYVRSVSFCVRVCVYVCVCAFLKFAKRYLCDIEKSYLTFPYLSFLFSKKWG